MVKFTFVTLNNTTWSTKRKKWGVLFNFIAADVLQKSEKLGNDIGAKAQSSCSPLTTVVLYPIKNHQQCITQ
jgi:hypothetical protein